MVDGVLLESYEDNPWPTLRFLQTDKERNMKFAQLNGLQISEDQVKDLQKQIDGLRYEDAVKAKVVGKGMIQMSGATSWEATDSPKDEGRFQLFAGGRHCWFMSKGACRDLIRFLEKCIEDIDNGVCG